MMILHLFIPLFILVYLSSTLVALPVLVYNPSRRQNNPPIPPPSTTFNYWWPYPPAGATTTTSPGATPQVVAPAPTTADHNPITLVLPLPPSPSPSTSSDPTLTSSSSTTTTGDDEISSTSTSSPAPTPSPSTTTSLTNSNSNTLTGSSSEHKKLNPLYILVPLISFVGIVCLLLVVWLLWGCCTRRPKYHVPPPPLRSKMDEEEEEREGEKCGLSGSVSADIEFEGLGEEEGRFKAFRYEDFPSFDGDHDQVEDGEGEVEVKRCEHTREYGFECDCRLSVVEGEMYREKFKWPGIGDFIREDEEGEEGGRRFSLSSNRTKSGERQISPVSSTVAPLSTTTSLSCCSTTTTDITTSHPPSRSSSSSSSTSTIKPKPPRPLTTTTAAAGHHATTIGTDTIGRQTKLLESVQLLEALDRCERDGTLPRPKKFRTWRAVKSVKRGRDRGGGGRGELQMMFDGDGEGTVRQSRRGRVSTGVSGEESGRERESWVGRMVRSLSRFSNSSASSGDGDAGGGGGEGGDGYMSLPPSTSFTRASQSPTKTTTRKKNKEKKAKKISLSRHPQSSHYTSDPPHPPYLAQPITETVTETDLLVDQIHRQKLRLARHRESIASLPSGMVYSPALVQMSGGMAFGDGGDVNEERGEESDKERGEGKRKREKTLPPRPF